MPNCGTIETRVINSRMAEDGDTALRRHASLYLLDVALLCLHCRSQKPRRSGRLGVTSPTIDFKLILEAKLT